jgi:tetratricopeptide (TPR) repeat protein
MILSSDVYTDFYERGNTAYRAGEYADAISDYEQLAASGVWTEEVYFNLGNAYYHQADLGRAILNFERAAAIAPDFQAARRNLDVVIAETKNRLARPPGFSLADRGPSWVSGISQPVFIGVMVAFWWLLWGILVRSRQGAAIPRKVAFALWILAGLCAVALAAPPPPIQSAVVTAHEAPLRYGPDVRDPARATLAAGDRLLVDRVDGAWARVETAPGERGWLDVSDLEFVGPPFAHPVTEREHFSK